MDNFEDWFLSDPDGEGVSLHTIVWELGPHKTRDIEGFIEEAYEAGKQSQQNRITELEEIISGREELQRGGVGY